MNLVIFLLCIVIEVGSAIIMRSIAKKRGANETLWFIVGLLIGPFAFLFIPFIKDKKIAYEL